MKTSKLRLLRGILKVRKKRWLAPIKVSIFLVSLLIIVAEGSAVAPFIYAIF